MVSKLNKIKGKILIVDDEDHLIDALSRLLELRGYTTQGVSNVTEALQVLTTDKFDVIISDIKMPGGSGYDLAGLSNMVTDDTPVILMSGNDSYEKMKKKGLPEGVTHFFTKPVDTTKLIEAVDDVIGIRG